MNSCEGSDCSSIDEFFAHPERASSRRWQIVDAFWRCSNITTQPCVLDREGRIILVWSLPTLYVQVEFISELVEWYARDRATRVSAGSEDVVSQDDAELRSWLERIDARH